MRLVTAAAICVISTTALAAPPADFGLEEQTLRKQREAQRSEAGYQEELVARVVTVDNRHGGMLRIELDNGQVWMETLHTAGAMPAEGETVKIRRGWFGSFLLDRDAGLALRVKRIK